MAKFIVVHGIKVAKVWEPETFNRLTSIGPAFKMGSVTHQVCVCDCGTCKVVKVNNWKRGHTKSCGCVRCEVVSERMHAFHASKPSYGNGAHRLYGVYRDMKNRCLNPRHKNYPRYGGRGIAICDRWLGETGFQNFVDDMGPTFQEGLSIDRRDNNGHYCPDNCRWATREEQCFNRCTTVNLTYEGKTQTLAQWSWELGIPINTLYCRRKRGLTTEQIFAPVKQRRPRVKKGEYR